MKNIKELETRIEIIEPHKSTGTGYEELKELKASLQALKDVLKLIDEFIDLYPTARIRFEKLKARITG